MFRPLMLIAAVAVAVPALPVASQEEPAPAGRFLLSSDSNQGFVRLDTKTGAVSHCGQQNGSWFCEPLPEAGMTAELAALTDKVASLSAGLDRLSARVDDLAARPVVATDETPDAADSEPGITGRVLQKFFDMVRTIKYQRSSES